jgi:hypothetical protein
MSINGALSLINDVVALVALLIGGALALFVFFQLAPVLELRILPSWTDDTKQFLILKFQVENKSRVRVYNPQGRIQILEHQIPLGASLSHWVPFEQGAVRSSEEPIEWRNPVGIFKSTKQIYPGETISFERLYHCPQDNVVLHVGLQVKLELGLVGRIVTRKREPWQQTATCFVVKQTRNSSNST